MYLTERRPLSLVAVPTLAHQVEDLLRTITRLRGTHLLVVMAIVMAAVLDDSFVRHRLEGLLSSEGQYLPQGHGERPNIALGRESALEHMIGFVIGEVLQLTIYLAYKFVSTVSIMNMFQCMTDFFIYYKYTSEVGYHWSLIIQNTRNRQSISGF